jgi:hypothetical protein
MRAQILQRGSAQQLIRLRRAERRTKLEPTATILLLNSVAAHDIERDVMDGRAKIFKKKQYGSERAVTTEFRVRCFQPGQPSLRKIGKCSSVAARYSLAAQVIEEQIQLAEDIRAARARPKTLLIRASCDRSPVHGRRQITPGFSGAMRSPTCPPGKTPGNYFGLARRPLELAFDSRFQVATLMRTLCGHDCSHAEGLYH